jgi:hypothetical protein
VRRCAFLGVRGGGSGDAKWATAAELRKGSGAKMPSLGSSLWVHGLGVGASTVLEWEYPRSWGWVRLRSWGGRGGLFRVDHFLFQGSCL